MKDDNRVRIANAAAKVAESLNPEQVPVIVIPSSVEESLAAETRHIDPQDDRIDSQRFLARARSDKGEERNDNSEGGSYKGIKCPEDQQKQWRPLFPILWTVLLLVLLLPTALSAQDSGEKKFQVRGYVKFLQSNSFAPIPGLDTTLKFTDNLIHNRLNLHYYPGERWKIAVESRNRLFWGDQVRQPGYGDLVDQYNGLLDLSVRWVDEGGFLLHSIIDRAYVNYSHKKWDVTVGRQRINWGVNLIWNPNDIFNAYNFLDFDYEERPGRDAIRVQYFPGSLSRAEVAFAPADSLENSVGAALYRFNAAATTFSSWPAIRKAT
jgi:hypothetical protein